MQRLKLALSSPAAKILIVPITLLCHLWTVWMPGYYSEFELEMDRRLYMRVIEEATSGAAEWITLSQYLLIGAPYLIGEHWVLRTPAIVVYLCSVVVPVLYLYSYVADGVYERILSPFVKESTVILGLAVTVLYVIALLTPSQTISSERNGA